MSTPVRMRTLWLFLFLVFGISWGAILAVMGFAAPPQRRSPPEAKRRGIIRSEGGKAKPAQG